MFEKSENQGKGIASLLLKELEKCADELMYKTSILETGVQQPEAINLYKKSDYKQISNYGQYEGVENSVCFEKVIYK